MPALSQILTSASPRRHPVWLRRARRLIAAALVMTGLAGVAFEPTREHEAL